MCPIATQKSGSLCGKSIPQISTRSRRAAKKSPPPAIILYEMKMQITDFLWNLWACMGYERFANYGFTEEFIKLRTTTVKGTTVIYGTITET